MCLGSGNAFGEGGRFQTSFYVRTSGAGMLIDCGASTCIAMNQQQLSDEDVDFVFITHFHGDHFGGLAFLLCEIRAMKRRTKPITIVGPDGIEARTKASLASFYPGVELKGEPSINFMTYTAAVPLTVGKARILAYPAVHSEGTSPHMLRLQAEDRVIAFSGDTGWTEDIIPLCDGSDIFVCEASAYDTPVAHHLSVKEIVANRHRLRASRIVLTHPGPDTLRHLAEIPFEVASDGQVLMAD